MTWRDRMDFKVSRAMQEVEYVADWRGWLRRIPFVPMREGWSVQFIPPFGGCLARFVVRREPGEERGVSVYLDGYGTMDSWKEPHWEVYPSEDGDTARCAMEETDELVRLIECGLAETKNRS